MQPDALIADWASAATPPPDLTVSQWADAERILPESSAARGARWRTAAVPYLRGVMDSVHEVGVSKIVLKKCAQSGGSSALENILAYFIKYDPSATLLVHPTDKVAEEWSKDRLSDLIRSTPALLDVVREGRSTRGAHEGESTLTLKMFPGGFLVIGGANTPNTFARRSVRVAMGDDVDRWPAVVGDEGDPAELLANRTITFYDALSIFVSTPTLKGGRIDTLYERSDQRQYFVSCPHCRHEDYITWSDALHFRVAFDERDADTARLECPECEAKLSEPQRRAMVLAGEWHPTAEPKEPGVVGFHLPAMLSTLGNITLAYLVEKWLSARERGKESLRVFVNTALAEGWEDRGAKMDPQNLLSRKEDYGQDADGHQIEVPQGGVCLTCGVDAQKDRFELQVIAWGAATERWVVDYQIIPGSTKDRETHEQLIQALNRSYRHASGSDLSILSTCLDTGAWTDALYDLVLRYQHKRIFAIKGKSGRSGHPIVEKPSEERRGHKDRRPVRLYIVNTDDGKSDLLNALSIVFDPGSGPKPGAIHFPVHLDTIDEEYFAQLCAEHRETKYKHGVATHYEWVLDRERNEALDNYVYALAAFRLLNPNIRQMAEQLGQMPPPRPSPARTTSTSKPWLGNRISNGRGQWLRGRR